MSEQKTLGLTEPSTGPEWPFKMIRNNYNTLQRRVKAAAVQMFTSVVPIM